jgi:hypothetical protein
MTRKQVIDMEIRKQNGLTLIGFFIVLTVVLFFAYTAMRLVPMYLEYYSLINAMDTLKSEPAAKSMAPRQIKENLRNKLWVSYSANNIKDQHIRISKKTDGINVRVKYEVRKPFMANIDIVGSFDRSVVLR